MPTAAAASTAATRALRLAVTAYDEDSPHAATLLEKAVEMCKAAGCTVSLQYARALLLLSAPCFSQGDFTQALRLADE